MIVDRRLVACLVLSVGAHVAFARAMRSLPKRADAPVKRVVSIRVVAGPAPEPPPEVEKPVAAPAPAPKPIPLARTRARRMPEVSEATPPKAAPSAEQPPAPSDAPSQGLPVFGVSMESTSQSGGGPAMPVGSPGAGREGHGGGGPEAKGKSAGGPPVPIYEVTEMPLPRRRCTGKYTDEAMQAGIEGTVILDLVIGVDGRVREARVVQGLGHGLDEAAVAAMKACPFSPGRRGDEVVPVRIPEFKVRFFQGDQ